MMLKPENVTSHTPPIMSWKNMVSFLEGSKTVRWQGKRKRGRKKNSLIAHMLMRKNDDGDLHSSETNFTRRGFHRTNSHRVN